MRKLVVAAALAALAIAVPLGSGSSHREAPLTSMDPTADETDVYAFTAPDAPGKLTMIANWIPFEDPAGGPNFYRFDDSARYYLNVDNTGDGKPDVRYQYDFATKVRNPNSFLYALGGPITSIGDADLNVVQTYKLTREKLRNGVVTSTKVLGKGIPTPPNNVGPKTTPNYEATANLAIRSLSGGVKTFAGQRDDPFYISLGRVFDTINLTGAGLGNMGGGVDDLAGYAVHSIALQVPESAVTKDGKPVASDAAGNSVVGVWASTERQTLKVTPGAKKGKFRQISRLGNPLVNELVIPLGQKDRFNRTTPDRDAELYGKYVVEPELARVLNALFDVGAPEKNRTDIVQAVLQGLPGVNAFKGKNAKTPTDSIKINLGTAPTATPNRLGALGNDLQGYPNGRRLIDDVVDIDLQVVAGALKGNSVPLGDGVDANNVPFLNVFPYVAPPKPGANPDAAFGSQLKTAGSAEAPQRLLAVQASEVTAGGTLTEDGGMGALSWALIAGAITALLAIGFTGGRVGRSTR